ncbi:MAG: RNA polymerase sigma-54 factor, partial [Bacteroidota bacterium]
MQKLNLSQTLGQKLSPQQIQFIKLLQVPTAELDTRIEEELEVNPALEEGKEEPQDDLNSQDEYEDSGNDNELDIADYLQDDYSGYKMQGDRNNPDEDDKELPISVGSTLQESLMMQMGYLKLNERKTTIARQLIGSIDEDGYIRRDLEAIVNDLAFAQNIETDLEELESVLYKVQTFDPAGIAARDLKECLLLQLERKSDQNETVLT